MNIVFVCTGNTCRSPMAEGFMKKLTCEDDNSYTITSRGIAVGMPSCASENAVIAALERGADISSHMSCQLSEEDIKNADIVITVTANHSRLIKDAFPEYAKKVYCASEITGGTQISDPFGGSIEIYRACANQIMDLCMKLYEKIRSENQ